MGQYHYVVNLDKKEYLYPHKLGDGLKLMEFGCSGCGTMTALAVLLASDNGRGGGDLCTESDLIGSWAGDRIVIAGDYGDEGKWLDEIELDDPNYEAKDTNLHDWAANHFKDISDEIRLIICQDSYVAEAMREAW